MPRPAERWTPAERSALLTTTDPETALALLARAFVGAADTVREAA